MAITPRRAISTAVTAVALAAALALPATASAATTIPAAPASQYNTTPDCPVSPTQQVCAWNLPVDAGNLFSAVDYGQCPYWAAEKYPALVLDELLTDPLGDNWDGGTWLEHAVQEGLGASTTPASGDLAVWQPEGGDTAGHIAYVEAVDGNAIIVSQMDGDSSAPFPADQGSTEWISGADLSYFEATYGLQFIATGNASSTPLADVEAPAPVTTTTATSTAAPKARTVGRRKTVKRAVKKTVKKVVKAKTAKTRVVSKRATKHRGAATNATSRTRRPSAV